MARLRSRAGAPRKLGPWLFAGVLVIFWALLAISGMDRFKAKDDRRQYTVPAAQLQGVTRLRIEGDPGDARGYVSTTRVVLQSTSDVTLSLHRRREGRRKGARAAAPASGSEPPLVAVREGDTLVLRWLPRGTHQYEKLVRPEEIETPLNSAGMQVIDRTGVFFSPIRDKWNLSKDMDVNYMLLAKRS